MPTRRNTLIGLISYATFLLALAVVAGRAAAQTASAPAGAAKQEAAVTTDAAVPGPTAADAVVMNARTDSAGADAKPEPPKEQPKEQPPAKGAPAAAAAPPNCRNVSADVVALFQPIMLNRMGAAIPSGLVFALARDLDQSGKMLRPGKRPRPLVLRANVGDCLTINFWNLVQPPATQPPPPPPTPTPSPAPTPLAFPDTKPISIHVQGMEWVQGPQDDGSYVGLNKSSLANPTVGSNPLPPPTQVYRLYAKNEGTFLLYTMGDTSTQGDQLVRGLFGAVNIQPQTAEWYRSQVTADEMALATYNANRLPAGATLGSCNSSNECTLTLSGGGGPPRQVKVIRTPNGNLNTMDNHPLINYSAVYPAGSKWGDGTPIPPGTPILQMLDTGGNPVDQGGKIVYSDLTAMITGPGAGRFHGTTGPNNPEPPCNAEKNPALPTGTNPLFCANPAAPDRKQPYREITIIYHGALSQIAMQAFPVFNDPAMIDTVQAGYDAFAINYGTGGIGAEIYANRIGVGPMGECVDCKYEEFFLSSWTVGDPAMLVDRPANSTVSLPAVNSNFLNMRNQRALVPPCNTTAAFEGNTASNPPGAPNAQCANARKPNPANPGGQVQPYTLVPLPKATKVFFPDDPSNVYHSYMNDHVKFRILHGGTDVSHVHHQHAHQWLQSPNSDESSYLDSQMISPGASYTLEMTYNGSGNRNKTAGDSIFHCHFYPHFAAGMWAMWRVHDTFESGTYVYPKGSTYPAGTMVNGQNVGGQDRSGAVVPGSRALPDGEIELGVPTPAIVPLPTIAMAPLPAYAQINKVIRVDGPNTVKLSTPLEPTVSGVCQNNMVNGMDVIGGCANGQNVNGTIINGQIVVGGTCQNNQVNGLTVVGGCANGQRVNGTVINSQFDGTQMTGQLVPSNNNRIENPGYPYFIPGIAGARAPHPPLDFAVDPNNGGIQDGGLPRHVVIGGEIGYERHNKFDWSKDLSKMNATQLPEDGTAVEKSAIAFFSKRCYETYFPDGTKGDCPSSQSTPPHSTLLKPPTGFILNGLPNGPQHGAPFADPGVDDNGNPVGTMRRYKIAAMQLNVVFNKQKWHYPQQRMLSLWQDVIPTYNYKFGQPNSGRQPEPLFIRGNAGDIVEFWHTNLVPNYYLVDDFQVRTPTDIIGQHVHLVKFDVTASDGAANGYNYEDGTYSPQEVQEMVKAINDAGGMMVAGTQKALALKNPPKEIIDCAANPTSPYCKKCDDHPTPTSRPMCPSWLGAQTTIQRWYLDPLVDNSNFDRTMRTTFTHDHFGPSTHQQAGLYAGLLIEPMGSVWKNSETGEVMPSPARTDGGPTSWKADILTRHPVTNLDISYREFMLEFQDFQLAYNQNSIQTPSDNPSQGWRNQPNAILPPPTPQLISTVLGRGPGTHSVNYLNEPLPLRVGQFGDPSNAFDSSVKQAGNAPPFGDPITPLMRAYQGDTVQVRVLVGAHVFSHQFNIAGPVWPAEPFWKDSGYRSAQAMGLSEHFELLFQVPSSATMNSSRKCPDGTSQGNCADFLYSPSLDELGLSNGMWGLLRSYDPRKGADKLQYLTNNPKDPNANLDYSTCPANTPPEKRRVFNVFAVTAQKALADINPVPGSSPKKGQIYFNDRGLRNTPPKPDETLHNRLGIMYVRAEDLVSSTPNTPGYGKLKPGSPVEPLVLRANAGDCIEVNLTNYIDPTSDVFKSKFKWAPPFDGQNFMRAPSTRVGLRPQLLAYDGALSNGVNVGWNSQGQQDQTAAFGQTVTYNWYAGKIERDPTTKALVYTPVEFGALNLFPSDLTFQNINGLFGSMIIEPAGSTWKCDKTGAPGSVDCDQPGPTPPATRAQATVTLADGSSFREFALMISDNMVISKSTLTTPPTTSAVNYRTEPMDFRYNSLNATDFSCMLSNALNQRSKFQIDPVTPLLTADVGQPVRFRMTHPFGTGTSQVFTIHGHVWQKNPYLNESTVIGDQLLSQWIGSRDNHGSSDHFDAVIGKAGGEFGQAGDYLYTVFVPIQARVGAWGIFRVGTPQAQPAKPQPGPPWTPCNPQPKQPGPPPAPKTNQRELRRFIRLPENTGATVNP